VEFKSKLYEVKLMLFFRKELVWKYTEMHNKIIIVQWWPIVEDTKVEFITKEYNAQEVKLIAAELTNASLNISCATRKMILGTMTKN